MAVIKEQVTSQAPIVLVSRIFTSTSSFFTDSIDTSGYEDGVYFTMSAFLTGFFPYISANIYHSDAPISGFTKVSQSDLVYGGGGSYHMSIYNFSTGDRTMQGLPCTREGVTGTKRYVRLEVVPPPADDGSIATIIAMRNPELLPTPASFTRTFS